MGLIAAFDPWVISMLLTVVSFLYMSGMWVWNEDLIVYTTPYKDIRHIVLFQYIFSRSCLMGTIDVDCASA